MISFSEGILCFFQPPKEHSLACFISNPLIDIFAELLTESHSPGSHPAKQEQLLILSKCPGLSSSCSKPSQAAQHLSKDKGQGTLCLCLSLPLRQSWDTRTITYFQLLKEVTFPYFVNCLIIPLSCWHPFLSAPYIIPQLRHCSFSYSLSNTPSQHWEHNFSPLSNPSLNLIPLKWLSLGPPYIQIFSDLFSPHSSIFLFLLI